MSSILDALKKSERQRSLGREPIFRQVAPDAAPRLNTRLLAVAGAVLSLAIVLGAVLFSKHRVPQEQVGPAVAPAHSDEGQHKQTQLPPARPEAVGKLSAAIPAAAPSTASIIPNAVASTAEPADTGAAPWLSSLPESFRTGLPPLEVNIHVYSPVEAQRILYINNRPARQGERIEAGVLVEEIVEDGVVLRFRGQRFKLPRPS